MTLPGKEQALVEPPGKIRLERADARFARALETRGAPREALDLGNVARRGDHERALACNAGDMSIPPVDRTTAQFDYLVRRALALAAWREHAAGEPRRVVSEVPRALDERNLRPALRERQRGD